jgi:acetylglutamate/LysW-gamma-L-alpha-aminoadipate kinase
VDGDTAAARLAVALKAEDFLMLSNVPGLLRDLRDRDSLVARIPAKAIEEFLPMARGRMKRKLMAAAIALEGGVGRVVLADANVDHPVTSALEGRGTIIQ